MENQFTYDIKENKFYLNGEPIVLTTDDVLWATDVHASGISPFGGIQENTIWKQYSSLTDTMRQLIEKAVLWTPFVTFSVHDIKTDETYQNQFPDYIEYNKQYEYIVTVIYHDGMYLNNQPAYCKCNSLNLNIFTEISSGSENPLIEIVEYVDKSDQLISKKNLMEKYSVSSPYDEVKKFKVTFYPNEEDESFDTYKVNLTFSYGKSEKLPVINGASDKYINDICIGESIGENDGIITKEFNDIKVSRPVIILTKFDSENILIDEIENITTDDKDVPVTELTDLPENSILLKELNDCPFRSFDTKNKFNFTNSVGDNIFIFAFPSDKIENSIKWYYKSPLSDQCDDIIDCDYSDLLTFKVIKFENVKYYLYAKSFCDPMLNSNSYIIEIN